jgi:molecular chaperone GrpE
MEEKIMQEEQSANEIRETAENNADSTSENELEQDRTDSKDLEIQKLQQQVAELKDKYLRQVADFDNFRKRTAKERLELIQTAGKDIISDLLPVLDDSERAEKQFEAAQDVTALKEGLKLVFGKLRSTLQSRGLKAMDSIGTDFNPEFHEAITEIPAPSENQKGKVLDEVQKGYYLNDKIIRFAKVVVGK